MRAGIVVFGLLPLFACGKFLSTDNLDAPGGADAPVVVDCSKRREPVEGDLYASPNGSPDSECRSHAPCTLSAALGRTGGGAVIHLSEGVYEGDITLPPRTRLVGGWRADAAGAWTPVCDPALVQLRGASGGAVVTAIDAPETRLDLLTVLSPARPAGPAESRYGVVARGPTTTLTLDGVVIVAGAGGDGVDGAGGDKGEDASEKTCEPGAGAPGADGPSGAPVDGSFGPDGYLTAAAAAGAPGAPGSAGTMGGAGELIDGMVCSKGPLGSCNRIGCKVEGDPGEAGCPGHPGTGGTGGTGGGGSFGLFAWSGATVTLLGGAVSSTVGGRGGAGGAGGPGGAGTAGTTGSSNGSLLCARACTNCVGAGATAAGGTAGGAGGKGGNGGQGGGGRGGPSFALVIGGSANVSIGTAKLVFDRGGAGGLPNGVEGQSGQRGP